MRSGLAEMLKHGLIYDKLYWDKLKNLNDLNTDDLDILIKQSIEIKNVSELLSDGRCLFQQLSYFFPMGKNIFIEKRKYCRNPK